MLIFRYGLKKEQDELEGQAVYACKLSGLVSSGVLVGQCYMI